MRSWVAWLVASACLFFQFVVQIQPAAMIPDLELSFQVDSVELALLSSVYFITYILLQVPVGWLLDRFGPRMVLGTSMILGAGGMLWFGYASSLDSAIAARAGLGIAGAPAFASAALVASRGFPAARFALMLGLTEAFTLLGGVTVTLLLPALEQLSSRTGSGVVLAVVSLVLAVGTFLFVGGPTSSSKDDALDRPETKRAPTRSVLRTITSPLVLLAGVHAGLFFGIISAFGGLWAAPFFRARLDLDPTVASQPVAVLFAAGVFGAPLLGWISGRARWRGPTLIIASGTCALAAALLLHGSGGPVFLFSMLALLGFFGGVFAVDLACVRDFVPPERRGIALAAANMLLGVVGGPLLLMVIAESLRMSSGTGEVIPMSAGIDQIRAALNWFVGSLVLAVPLGVALVLIMRSRARSMSGIS
jgi:MFS family permease